MQFSLQISICATLLALAIPAASAGDFDVNIRSHQATTPPPSARFELIQSSIVAKWTFRLDKYTGRVWNIVTTKDERNAWEEMQILGAIKLSPPFHSRFQLFTSGIAARHTFLLDTDTGKSWVVVTSTRKAKDGTEYDVNVWQPFADQ